MECIFIIQIIITGLFFLFILLLFEVGLFKVLWYIILKIINPNNIENKIYKIYSFILCVLINYFSLRINAIHGIYQWQFPFQSFNIYFESRKNAKNFRKCFKSLKYSLISLGDPSNIIIKSEIENIKLSFEIIDSLKNNYELCKIKFGKISSYQNNFYQYLIYLNTEMQESGFRKYFENFKIKKHSKIICDWHQNKNGILDSNKKYNLSKMIFIINFILDIFDKFILDHSFFSSYKFLKNLLLNDTFGNLNYYRIEFYKKFEDYKIEEFNEGKINYCIISNNKSNKKIKNKSLFFFCGPNGGPFEFIAGKKLKFYLDKNIDVLLWNYRGYGYSKGRASFSTTKNDVLKIFDEGTKKYKYDKIIVEGYSIGGVAATYLANHRKIDILISDRNFASIHKVVNCFFCGKLLYFLTYFFFIVGNYTINNFIESNCYKIILFSSKDLVIRNCSSLKSNVIVELMNKFVRIKNEDKHKCEDILDLIFTKNQKNAFINSFIFVCDYYYIKKQENQIFDDFNSFGEEKEFLINEINEVQNKENIDKCLFNFFNNFVNICCEELKDISTKKYSYRIKSLFVRDFFTNFILWGVQSKKFVKINNQSKDLGFYNESCKEILKSCYNELYKIKTLNFNDNEILNNIIILCDLLSIFIDKLDLLEVVNYMNRETILSLIAKDNEFPEEDNYFSDNEINEDGYIKFCRDFNSIKNNLKLIKISCGHNGLMTDEEYQQYLHYLIDAHFIQN